MGLTVAMVLSAGALAAGATLRVPGDYTSIQEAIDAAVTGDQVLVSPGTYEEELRFHGKAITVTSTDPLDSLVVAATVVWATHGSGARFDGGEGPDSQLLGFTLTRGIGTRCFHGHGPNRGGGGVFCTESSPTIAHCFIHGNIVQGDETRGAGIYVKDGAPTITDCVIRGNRGHVSGGARYGGGIFAEGADLLIEDCRIKGNNGYTGGAIYATEQSRLTIRGTMIEGNQMFLERGIISAFDGSELTMEGCVIRDHKKCGIYCIDASLSLVGCRLESNGGGGGAGGGVRMAGSFSLLVDGSRIEQNWTENRGGGLSCEGEPPLGSNVTISSSTFIGNAAETGGSLWLHNVQAEITGCTFSDNKATDRNSAGIEWSSSDVALLGSILWENGEHEIVPDAEGVTVDYCDIAGGWPTGVGNLDSDPLFCSPECLERDFHLASGSPCLGAGPDGSDIGALGVGCEEPQEHSPAVLEVPADFPSIAAAVEAACNRDTVRIAPGTYFESGLGFNGMNIVITGVAPQDPEVVAATVIDGGGSVKPVFEFDHVESAESVLQGVTVTGGGAKHGAGIFVGFSSPTIAHCVIRDNSSDIPGNAGAGIYCAEMSNALILDCIIENNRARDGGGVLVDENAPLYMSRCTLRGNRARVGGGGVRARTPALTLKDCLFENNVAEGDGGGGLWAEGGTLINCDFVGNHCGDSGGGLMVWSGDPGPLVASGLRFIDNEADDGGAILCWDPVVVRNSLFVGNRALVREGGAIAAAFSATSTFENCTFIDNSAANGRGNVVYLSLGLSLVVTMRNCILWDNPEPEISKGWEAGDVAMTYSRTTGLWIGQGNIRSDPRIGPPRAGFEGLLLPSSPCVDSGDPALSDAIYDSHPRWPAGFPDAMRSDMGAYGGPGNDVWLRRLSQ
jgi:hypothetical protein